VDLLKMTPAHLALLREAGGSARRVRTLILGGEALTTDMANAALDLFGGDVAIYNEYGPSEATVGCMVHAYDRHNDHREQVPIGTPIANTQIYCLDESLRPVPTGLRGEIAIAGAGLAQGYLGQPALTAARFVDNPFNPGERLYRTGDAGRWSLAGELEYLGRLDQQVKVRGVRVELEDVAVALGRCAEVEEALVVATAPEEHVTVQHCSRCGLPSNYPGVRFDQDQVCGLCRAWERYGAEASAFFGSSAELDEIIRKVRTQAAENGSEIDALVLVSGGKDSTYMLHQLANRGLRLLALTLDNGFLSEQALENARRSTRDLGVELLTVRTEHMNAIFADSLSRHSNVCHGCFKTIYTLALNEAKARGIGAIFTGLSRGQIFETRLDDMFRARQFDVPTMESAILDARKVYHRVDDAVRQLLDTSIFSDDQVFEDICFIDFYRYIDVSLDEVYDYLDKRAPWVRPGDTGRSTNCLINDAGIFVHRRERGFHNYALPYSWDVRLGHKTREAAMYELDDDMDAVRVRRILHEVGYAPGAARDETRLVAYYRAADPIDPGQLRRQLQKLLPAELIPADFVHMTAFPLAGNGKLDRNQLPVPEAGATSQAPYVAPSSETERHIAAIWSDLLERPQPGVHDDFFDLGGRSLSVIQVVARIRSDFAIRFPMETFFAAPTIAAQAEAVEAELMHDIDALSDEEVAALLAQSEP
jgi:acyl-CoA synthetase (AMP-forming)/AMP-acid ligase II/acyl carrier protein